MKSTAAEKRVTVFLGETDHHGSVPTYEAVVRLLREQGVSGATAMRGVLGYGQSAHLHAAHLLDLAEDLPVTVTFVDTAEKVESVLPLLDELIESGLVTVEDVSATRYTRG